MLKEILIQNLVLVEKAHIPFNKGLNIISGETGAGKSALLHALRLLTGEKGDHTLIRHGETKAIVEASFKNERLFELLDKNDITYDPTEPIVIRRELNSSGKSRAFVNDQLVSISVLKNVSSELIDIASQHATHKLYEMSFHRTLLDTFANLENRVKVFGKRYDELEKLKEEYKQSIINTQKREREAETLKREVEEIEEAKLTIGEDEELFTEYERLSTAQDRASKAKEIIDSLPSFLRTRNNLEELSRLDPELAPLFETFKAASIEVEETKFDLARYLNRIQNSPEKHRAIEERLKEITQLKKKYGDSIEKILVYREEALKRLDEIENFDACLIELKEKIESEEKALQEEASLISQARENALESFESSMHKELEHLNLSDAKFEVEKSLREMSRTGIDDIAFYFTPNKGGRRIAIHDGASGGELNRLLLSIKSILAGKEGISTLVFDEIDANIGGATAVKVGEKLKHLGTQSQVICITHFPQVAKFAEHHLRVHKNETEGRTKTFIDVLTASEREFELSRMAGVTR